MITFVAPGRRRRRAVIVAAALTAAIPLAVVVTASVRAPASTGAADTALAAPPADPVKGGSLPVDAGPPAVASTDVTPPDRAPLPGPSLPVTRVPTGLPSARAPLNRLAAALTTDPADRAAGGVEHVRELQWVTSTAVGGGHATTTIRPITVDRWWSPDRSGRVQTRAYPPGTNPLAPGTQRSKATTTMYAPGELAGPVVLPSDPAALTTLLRSTAPETGVAGMIDAVVQLGSTRVPPRATRAALLRMLAAAHLDWRGHTTDRAGHDTLTLSADTRGGHSPAVTRLVLRLDPRTGFLTGFERIVLSNPGGLPGRFPQTLDLRLFVTHHRQTTVPAATPDEVRP